MNKKNDQFRGCLIGGAAGDALGYAVEFMSENSIFSDYGEEGIKEYALINGVARISDDTQMTLFTANGLLCAATQGAKRGTPGPYESCIWEMYKYWYRTQTEDFPIDDVRCISWLMNIPELFSRRAPGNTCMSAIYYGTPGTIEEPINNSKGCGGVMRVAPIGLYFCDKTDFDDDFVDMLGAKSAALTHGHDLGYIPAAALSNIIRAIVGKEATPKQAVDGALSAVNRLFSGSGYIGQFTALIQKAQLLAESDCDDLSAIHQLGEGWVAEETLAIAVYCALKYRDDFDKALRAAVNHNGDSDSTGAVTGNILGAYIGYEAIPEKYKTDLELRDLILEIADDLFADRRSDEQGPDIEWNRKYITADHKRKD